MTRDEYTGQVLANLRRVTERERESIRAEIDAHMEDHICGLLDLGYPPELAEERTMALMGDPAEVGRELDRQYPMRWLIIGRIAKAALILAVLAAVLGMSTGVYGTYRSLQARLAPWSFISDSWEAEINQKLDIRLSIGSDILRVLGSGTGETEDGEAEATVLLCWYDRSPFGYTSGLGAVLEDCRGEVCAGGGGRTNTSGVAEYQDWQGAVQYGDPYVTVVCERYGQRYEARVPLVWEDGT